MNCDFGNPFFAVIVVCNQIIIHEISISRDGKYYIFIDRMSEPLFFEA